MPKNSLYSGQKINTGEPGEGSMKDEILIKILKNIIGKLYDVEHCGGDWNLECDEILSVKCAACCQGKKLLSYLEQID